MSDEPLDAGFLYSPRFWPHDKPWTPKPGQCRAYVSSVDSFGGHQCTRKVKVERDVLHHGKPVRVGYCGQHDPVVVAAKSKARQAKWEAEWAEKNRKWEESARLDKLGDAATDALRRIAAGHNDPRGLAQEVLIAHGETP